METLSINIPFRSPSLLVWELSFKPYLDFLEAEIKASENPLYISFLRSITEILYANPVLLKPIEDWSVLDSFKDLIGIIQQNHLPANNGNPLFAMGTPLPMRFFSYSDSFKEMITDENGDLKLRPHDDFSNEEHQRRLYKDILYKCYGIEDIGRKHSQLLMRVTDNGVSFKRYFHFIGNNQFVNINHEGTLPELQPEWIEYAKGNIVSLREMEHLIPMEKFTFEGFVLLLIKDETREESLHELRENVATMHTLSRKEAFIRMKRNTLSLLEEEHLEVGFLPLVEINNKILYHKYLNYTSILIRLLQKHLPVVSLNRFFENFINNCTKHRDFSVQIHKSTKDEDSEIAHILELEGIKNLAIVPVYHQQNLVGVIELASIGDEPITIDSIRKIEYAMPMFREFIVYQTDKLHEQMQSFIMHNYSAIQPEIEWKFNEVAWEAMQHAPGATAPDIIFRQLTPFYGSVDIRNSSVERQHAVFSDAASQLKNFQSVLEEKKANDADLSSQISNWLQIIENDLADEQELQLRRFIETTTLAIQLKFPEVNLSEIHWAENNHEKSITAINAALKEVLEAQEQKLKRSTPVYFDKFRTDGWEYSIYVGQELNPALAFSPDIISKIKKWELETILNMGFSAAAIRKTLPSPLATTQLILAHTNPLDIRFRLDEHRFGVEGSYSIRYEVIKKRIDKVSIRDTHERLTQPGKIAIAYLYADEIEPYLEAIQTYIQEGKLLDQVEYLNLEDLQGVIGLKAIRVSMNMNAL